MGGWIVIGWDLLSVERVHIDRYRHTLTGVPATVAQKLAAVCSFYRYAVSAGVVIINPVDLVARPRFRQTTRPHRASARTRHAPCSRRREPMAPAHTPS